MVKKFGGNLIYTIEDSYGLIDIIDYSTAIRGLHFNNEYQQSSMLLHNPTILVQNYTQAMLTPLCWSNPSNALILGMGGGSQINYLFKFLDSICIDCVELRKIMTKLAHEYFELPIEDPRLSIITESAETYLQRNSQHYDLILVDIFLRPEDKGFFLHQRAILEHLFGAMNSNGTICINTLGGNYQQHSDFEKNIRTFNGYSYALLTDDHHQILISRKSPLPIGDQINFSWVENRYGLPFKKYFSRIM